MADYLKRVWAEKYTAARNSDNDLDYEALSKLTQFKAFKNNPEEIQRHEPALLKEFYEVYLADQALKADAHVQTAGSGSSKLSQRGGAEHLAIEQYDIQAAQQLTAARTLASDQAPGPPISQTPVVVQEEGAPARSLQTHPLRGEYANFELSISQALQQFRKKLGEEQARSRKLEGQLAAARNELTELRNFDLPDNDITIALMKELRNSILQLAEEKAISSGLRNKLAHVETELNLSKQSVTTHADNLLKAQASHAKKLQDVHEDMNNLTREVDARKKKLEDRENEVAREEYGEQGGRTTSQSRGAAIA
ncbi:hypothetical protein PHYSODRAFT_251915 [Phytophthora sojae]|uniref:Uncharacterized protein n=1 Tax=Phytophthora sojae (strain P6497) TaxID=1094619 RepID=G4Z0N1_PHYSP|nr:hypothetical protein PHYSODRAFT_251915 [Phytophthora sojae]EGZ25880.1 hypothetical protein PHYSODRAFT_251915 [Phytophthora sojae]|eukprot:XP_009521168.1 hypothetical protein PHYSODRAFT_251915 [Phytophthora sojae]